MSNIKVCACEMMPGLHHAGKDACEKENLVVFSKEEIQEQEKCEHEVYDQVCGCCGKVFEVCSSCGENEEECLCTCHCDKHQSGPGNHMWAPSEGCPKNIVVLD